MQWVLGAESSSAETQFLCAQLVANKPSTDQSHASVSATTRLLRRAAFGDAAGNRVNADNELISDFNGAEYLPVCRPVDGLISGNALLFASHVSNLGANDADSGYVLGAKLKSSRLDLGWIISDLKRTRCSAA